MKYIITAITLLMLTAAACKKDNLTKETQTGANTFSCKVNGKVFTPCNGGLFSGGPSLYGHYSNNFTTIYIGADCTREYPFEFINIEIDNFHGIGEYLLSDLNNFCTYRVSNPVDKYYYSKITQNGKVIITKDDRINSILSGTFEFTGADKTNPSDIVTVSAGRFDIKTN